MIASITSHGDYQGFNRGSPLTKINNEIYVSLWIPRFRLEWRKQRWQKKRVALKEPVNSILSILLHLFHKSKSEFLTRSVEKGMSAIRLGKSDVKPQVCKCNHIFLHQFFNSNCICNGRASREFIFRISRVLF